MLYNSFEVTLKERIGMLKMDKEKEKNIRIAAEKLFKLERSFEAMGIVNTPEDFEEAKQLRIEYEVYRAKVFEAKAELKVLQMLKLEGYE